MATGDEENYIQLGIAEITDNDEEIYPASETENHQYQYAMAGKGLFGLMRRCIGIAAEEPGSHLAGHDLSEYFADSQGSKTTVQIWESSLAGGVPEDETKTIADRVGPEAYAELQQIAGKIVERVIGSIANSVVSTIVKMGPAVNKKGHLVFFEGSVVNNRNILPRVKAEIVRRINNAGLYSRMGVPQPILPDMERTLKPLKACGELPEALLADVDITLIGAASSVMAETCLRKQG
jgi:hypothetical protein